MIGFTNPHLASVERKKERKKEKKERERERERERKKEKVKRKKERNQLLKIINIHLTIHRVLLKNVSKAKDENGIMASHKLNEL